MAFLVIGAFSLIVAVAVGILAFKSYGLEELIFDGSYTFVFSFAIFTLISILISSFTPFEEKILFEERFPIVESERVKVFEINDTIYIAFYMSDMNELIVKKYEDWEKEKMGKKVLL